VQKNKNFCGKKQGFKLSVFRTAFNMKGQKIRHLLSDEYPAGKHSVIWNGENNNGNLVASGMYMYQVKTERYSTTKKMIMMK